MIKDLCPEYIINPKNSIIRKQLNFLKNEQEFNIHFLKEHTQMPKGAYD